MKRTTLRRLRARDLLAMATVSLLGNKLRTALTVLGIVIGVAVVVAVMTVLSAVQQSINSGLAQLGANTFEIAKMPRVQVGGDGWWRYIRRPSVTYRLAYEFERLMAGQHVLVTPNESVNGLRASYGDRRLSTYIRLHGANENYPVTHNRNVETGRFLSGDDVFFRRRVAVIGSALREELFPSEDPIGKRVTLGGNPYTVVGVLTHKGEAFGEDLDRVAIVPITIFIQHHWDDFWQSISIAVQAPDGASVAATQDLAIGTMRIVRRLEPEEPNDFEVYSNDSLQETFDRMAGIVGAAGLLISAIALVTAGVGVMNIMLVSVTERTREIGVRKSIGARSRDIMRQFLLEAVFIAQVGAVIGIAAGVAAGNWVGSLMNVSPIMPWFWIVMAVVTCAGIGVVFGLYPAWRASRLHPVDALRFE